jgi:hypothetical protein
MLSGPPLTGHGSFRAVFCESAMSQRSAVPVRRERIFSPDQLDERNALPWQRERQNETSVDDGPATRWRERWQLAGFLERGIIPRPLN